MLTIGTGIGGCIVLDGKVFHGFSNSACEVGYMHMDDSDFQTLGAASILSKKISQWKGEPEEKWEDVYKRQIEYWLDIYKNCSPKDSVNYAVLDQANLFYQGKTAFDFNSGFQISGVETNSPDLVDQIDCAPVSYTHL